MKGLVQHKFLPSEITINSKDITYYGNTKTLSIVCSSFPFEVVASARQYPITHECVHTSRNYRAYLCQFRTGIMSTILIQSRA